MHSSFSPNVTDHASSDAALSLQAACRHVVGGSICSIQALAVSEEGIDGRWKLSVK